MSKRNIISFFFLVTCISGAYALPIRVDVGAGPVKAGWTGMSSVNGSDGVVTVEGITFTASCYLAGDEKWRDYSGGDLGRDYFDCDNGYGNPNGSIILTISGLPAGDYVFTSYHNYAMPDYRCPLDITVSGAVSASTSATDVAITENTVDDNNLGSGTVTFTATGTGNVIISFVPTCGTRPEGMMCLNGFELDLANTTVQFAQPSSSGLEEVSPALVEVALSDSMGSVVSVDYEVVGGSADRPDDYVLADGTVTFDPGETSKNISIEIIDDGEDEEDETIVLNLLNPGGGIVLGSVTEHTYTILDPRPEVAFDSTSSIEDEDSGSALISVSLTHTWTEQVQVDYSFTPGTAVYGEDYVAADGTLTFESGEITKLIPVTIIDDPNADGPKTVNITLSNPDGSKLGSPAGHILTINDDEMGITYFNSLGMEFVLVTAGTFEMGEGDGLRIQDGTYGDYDEQPAHKVTISKPYYVSVNMVTQAQLDTAGLGVSADDISWNDANAFASWLSALEGRDYHLATEAQWEYAYETSGANFTGKWEWTNDWHEGFKHDHLYDPAGPLKGFLKVVRHDEKERNTLATNHTYQPWQLGETQACGFRLVLEHDPPASQDVSPGPFCQAAVKQSTAPALQGPDPEVPYFTVRFALPIPPDNIEDGIASLLGCDPATMHHNHSPGFEIMPNGDALAVYFTAHGSEYAPDCRLVQARWRYGSDKWDMPELFWDMKEMNDESPLLWREEDGTVHVFAGGRIANSDRRPFSIASSSDSGATWKHYRPNFPVPAVSFTAQPVTNAWRANATTIYMVTDGASADSLVWESTDNGLTWNDTGGRTTTRHSTIVPLTDGSWLSIGGKNSYIGDYYMPKNYSYDSGATWTSPAATPFSHLGSNQRPNIIRLANGKLAFCSDGQHRDGTRPSAATYGRGTIVAISNDEGLTWHIKNLPVGLCHESDHDDDTLGYSTIRQAPDGTLHILSTMTHPCLHYELNEAWIFSEDGDIPPETTGGTVNAYSENYPSGSLRTTWSARTCPNGRYLLHGAEVSYYEDGTVEHEVNYVNGKKSGAENFYGPDGTKIWSWQHNDVSNVSVWSQYWADGSKRVESNWDTYPVARDLARNFPGFVADGSAYHWDHCARLVKEYIFSNGTYLGEVPLADPPDDLSADLTDDCRVDGDDLQMLGDDWLVMGQAVEVNEPDSSKLVLHYAFDESSGTSVADSGPGGYTGYFFDSIDRVPADLTARMDPGRTGNSIHFSARIHHAGVAIPPALFTENPISQEITVSCWVRNLHTEESPDSGAFMWEFRQWDGIATTTGARVLAVETISNNDEFSFRDDSQSTSVTQDWSSLTDWTHYAFVRDASFLKIYVNGELASQGSSSGAALTAPGMLNFGVAADRGPGNTSGLHDGFTGNIDDLRIYEYALEQSETAYLAFDSFGGFLPADSPANLLEDEIIDLKDFSVLAEQWLNGVEP